MKVSDSLVNVPNELSQLGTNQQTDRVTDQLHELLEWLFATKNIQTGDINSVIEPPKV